MKTNRKQMKTKEKHWGIIGFQDFICRHLQWPNCTSYIPYAGTQKTTDEQIKIKKNSHTNTKTIGNHCVSFANLTRGQTVPLIFLGQEPKSFEKSTD